MTGPTAPQTAVDAARSWEAIAAEHRICGKPYEGCYSHWDHIRHCRADGMSWPCDVELIRGAIRAESSAELVPIDVERLSRTLTPDYYKRLADDILAFPTDDITAEDVARLTAERIATEYRAIAPADAAGGREARGE